MIESASMQGAPPPDPIALWVVPVSDLGGVARHVLDAATTGLPGWRIVVLAPSGPLIDACHTLGVPAITGSLGPEHGLRRSVRTLRRCAKRLQPTIIHTHLAHADLTAALAFRRRRGAVLISTEHGISGDPALYADSRLRSLATVQAHRMRLRAFDGVIAVSRSTREQILKRWRPPKRLPIETIPNGINRDFSAPAERPSGLRFATLSRLSHEKRLTASLRAFAEIHRIEPEARLTVAGEGPDLAALNDLCTELDISEAVAFEGFVESRELLRRTDVIMQLSAWENCSYTLLDALNSATGVVATAVGGNSELLPATCLFDADDAPAIARAAIEQARSQQLRPTLPDGWPTVSEMTTSIAALYAKVAR